MCGIVGILSGTSVATPMIEALKRLEYRGYDSAGIATLEAGHLSRRRARGTLKNLEAKLRRQPLGGSVGIGHTRWATHGKPSEANAHPHVGKHLALVHNGIIENYRELRSELSSKVVFSSETDSETVVHLVDLAIGEGKTPLEAIRSVLPRLRGAFALVFLFEGEENLLIAARHKSPLAIGYGDHEMFVGSDAIALAPFTNTISYLDDGDIAVIGRDRVEVTNIDGAIVVRPQIRSAATGFLAEKGLHRHFMAKEIAEQPLVLAQALKMHLDAATATVRDIALPFDCARLSRISLSGCGTAYYAAMIAKYYFERFCRLPVEVDLASEFRYREAPLEPGNLSVFVSQSGETADTLASLAYSADHAQHIASVVNVPTSSIARASHIAMATHAGTEVGVASTKAFTCQLATLASLAITIGRRRGTLSEADECRLVRELLDVPRLMAEALGMTSDVRQIARELSKSRDVLYLGRGTSFPLALEGALKLKEISYIHAEGYAAGELKHGPIALIDKTMPVVVIAPFDHVFEKTLSNMQEVIARGGRVLLITDARGVRLAGDGVWRTIVMPEMADIATPLVYAIPIQLLAYHAAVALGKNVDQPRNLAKSVTVE